MEDYDKFAQLHLSHLRKRKEENDRPSTAPSLIRFYGRSILPPLLSGERREEMQRDRDAAQKAAVHRQLKVDGRMAYVQTILQGVQLRKTVTLEELLQESEIDTKSSHSHNASDESTSQSSNILATKDKLFTPPPERKEKDVFSPPPQRSTTHSAFIASNATPREICQEKYLTDKHNSQQGSQPYSLNGANHQSVSSGFMTNENVENTTSVSGGKEAVGDSHGFDSLEGVSHVGGFFLHNTSSTIAKMPDIIIHPPIDGEELERSGLELSFSNDFIVVKDIYCSLIQDDSIMYDHSPVEKCKSCHVDSTEGGDKLPVTTVLDLDRDHSLDRIESLISSPENSGFLDNPASPQTLSATHCPAGEQHIQLVPSETEPAGHNDDEAEPSDEPDRLSLQALLKKSQEYRRRQRMLRNQAKNTKIHETNQEQARARTEEWSLSDKENDEFPHTANVTADGRKTPERRGTSMPSVQTSPKKSWVNERMIEGESLKSESTHLQGNGNTKEMNVEEETLLKNNRLNISKEVITEPKEIGTFPRQQDTFTETSLEDFDPPTYSTAFHKGLRKYNTNLAPNFCRSLVHCKGSIQDVEVSDEPETSKMDVCVNMGLNKDHEAEEVYREHQNGHKAVPFIVDLTVEGDATRVSATSSQQHIDQLKYTPTENFENHGQTGQNTESHFSSEDVKHFDHMHLSRSDSVCSEGKRKNGTNDHDVEWDQRYREERRRQSLDNFKNMPEGTGSQPSVTDTDDVPPTVQFIGTETVNLRQLGLVKTLATEGAQAKGACKEILTKSNGQHNDSRKQQPPAKCIPSVAQWLGIPEFFRNTPSENAAPHNVSVLLDTSNHQEERRPETAVEGHHSTALSSLNQSHDADAPSDPWFLEGTVPDLGSRGHLVPEKRLTPRSGGGGQCDVSKVKRRLLMQETADAGRGGGSTVRAKSSSPTAAVWWQEGRGGQKYEREQLRSDQAAQLRALQDEHRRQEEELLQALAARYHLLQSMSFPCSMSSSHHGDTLTFSTLSQSAVFTPLSISPVSEPSRPMSERCRPLLVAAVKGFLTRRLLKTEKVAQLVRTIRDTQQFLQALQHQSPGRGDPLSREDLLLQERATVQLRAARYEVNDIFFNLPAEERMQLISRDRELARERERNRRGGHKGQPRGKSSLSAATRKSLERKRGMMIQKKAAERHGGVVTRAGHCISFSAEKPPETKRGQFRANPQRVPKSSYSSRPR